MKDKAVLQGTINHRNCLWGLALLLSAALLLAGFAETASARVVGKDGKLYACYRVKGKPKGAVRLVAKKARCKRGERKVQWQRAAPGPQGSPGAQGTPGQAGATGPAGTSALETKVSELTTRVASLEATLAGVSNTALLGALDDVDQLCGQTTDLTDQANGMLGALEDAGLGGVIPIGLSLLIPGLPTEALPSFDC